MKVAHVSMALSSNSAATRLMAAENRYGINVFALLKLPSNSLERFELIDHKKKTFFFKVLRKIDYLVMRLFKKKSDLPWNHFISDSSLEESIVRIKPDLIHLHWIANGAISLKSLGNIDLPTVWTFHDVWPLTAGCHCNLGCNKWESGCFDCPQLGESALPFSYSHLMWLLKKSIVSHSKNLTIIAPSNWLFEMVKKSPIYKDFSVHMVHNCIDHTIFKRLNKGELRKKYGVPGGKKVLVFGAIGGAEVSYKGFHLLKGALVHLRKSSLQDYHLLIFGSENKVTLELPYSYTDVGYISTEQELAEIYNCADVFVGPSMQDNLPNVFIEAISCGVPCVGFNIGGISDIVKHKWNGYLAKPFDEIDFAAGIEWSFSSETDYSQLQINARKHSEQNFSYDIIAEKHNEIYKSLIKC